MLSRQELNKSKIKLENIVKLKIKSILRVTSEKTKKSNEIKLKTTQSYNGNFFN